MLNCIVVYVEWLWMQKDRQSSTPEEGEDMAGGNDQNVLEETAGSISVEESVVEQGLGFLLCVT